MSEISVAFFMNAALFFMVTFCFLYKKQEVSLNIHIHANVRAEHLFATCTHPLCRASQRRVRRSDSGGEVA